MRSTRTTTARPSTSTTISMSTTRPTTTGTGSTTTTVVTVAPTVIGTPGSSTTTMDTARTPRSIQAPEDGPTTTHGFEGLAGEGSHPVAHDEQHPPNTPCHVDTRGPGPEAQDRSGTMVRCSMHLTNHVDGPERPTIG